MTVRTSTPIPVVLSYQGKAVELTGITSETTGSELYQASRQALDDHLTVNATTTTSTATPSTAEIKILAKGKRIVPDSNPWMTTITLSSNISNSATKKPLKLFVMMTSSQQVQLIVTQRSDPTIRGFEDNLQPKSTTQQKTQYLPWGTQHRGQDKEFKFCRFEACTWQSFGHRRIDDQAPHTFRAMQLLEQLAMDPGIVAVMKERELVVGTLGEMDPIDDRIMQKKQAQGACLLGYNTNAGSRIDIKLRTDDLHGFRPYPQLVTTLLHELSHNWVGEHNQLFWANYGQMRAEYLFRHYALSSVLVQGKTTAELAGLSSLATSYSSSSSSIYEILVQELIPEMGQHGLHPHMIEGPLRQRCQELQEELAKGYRLGGSDKSSLSDNARRSADTGGGMTARERALEAAEQRRKEKEQTPPAPRNEES